MPRCLPSFGSNKCTHINRPHRKQLWLLTLVGAQFLGIAAAQSKVGIININAAIASTKDGQKAIGDLETRFAEFGGYTAEGFTMGVEGGAPAASAAVGSLVAPGPLRSFGTGGASVSGVTVNLTVNVDGGDSAEEVAGAAVEKIKSAMTDVFRGIAIELGAEPAAV